MATTLPKTFKRKRGIPVHPRRTNIRDPRITLNPQLAVYAGRDRLGSVQRDRDTFVARSRRGRVIGTFSTQATAVDAIEREAVS
jgi:hypothetical protein